MLGVISAVGGCAQIIKSLYQYYDLHKQNKALLDILEGFSQNLEVSIQRLKVREDLLVGSENPALDSIEKDFVNARVWLEKNDKNLRSIWTTLQAADKLRDLDDRLTKAFASKMSCAIFSALQDVRHATTKIQTTLEGLPENLEAVCRDATREGIQKGILALKEEAYMASGGGLGREHGFHNGEAEKLISQLVDQLSAQERIKEEEEEDEARSILSFAPSPDYAIASSQRPIPVPYRSSTAPPVPYEPAPSSHNRSLSTSSAFRPRPSSSLALSRPTSISSGGAQSFDDHDSLFTRGTAVSGGSVTSGAPTERSNVTSSVARESKPKIPAGSLVFISKDPFDQSILIDPVLASDGMIHDRWTLIDGEGSWKNMRDLTSPLVIVGDVVQLREAIFSSFPDRKTEYKARRQAYREETIELYRTCPHTCLPQLINRLSHILLWEPSSISLRIRRGIALYRLRDLGAAERDLTEAVKLSMRDKEGQDGVHAPDLDAMRARALVREEMHDFDAALRDVEHVLAASPTDILALSLRASLRASKGDLQGSQSDLVRSNEAVLNEKAYRSRLGDSDCDLEYLARGWAYVSLRDFAAAIGDFSYSLGLTTAPEEPYMLACRGLAVVQHELSSGSLSPSALTSGFSDLDKSIALHAEFGASILTLQSQDKMPAEGKWSSGASVPVIAEEGGMSFGRQAFASFFLRGSAKYAMNDFSAALEDYEAGKRLRPAEVKDTSPFRAALAEMRVETGDRDGAARDFDWAVALDPSSRFAIQTTREGYGL